MSLELQNFYIYSSPSTSLSYLIGMLVMFTWCHLIGYLNWFLFYNLWGDWIRVPGNYCLRLMFRTPGNTNETLSQSEMRIPPLGLHFRSLMIGEWELSCWISNCVYKQRMTPRCMIEETTLHRLASGHFFI